MKQHDKRAIWLVLAGVGMAALAVFMYMAAERLRKKPVNEKREAQPTTEAALTFSPAPAPVAVKPIVQPTLSAPAPQSEQLVEAAPMEPPPRYVYAEDPIEKAARDYDANGQIGEPPPGWKDDYSHWDSENWGMPVEELGLLYPDGEVDYTFHTFKLSAEGEKKLMEELESIRQEKGEEAAKEFISDTPKTGVVRVDDEYLDDMSYTDVELADGKTVYVALIQYNVYGYRSFGNRFREFSAPCGFSIGYCRRDPDGALLRRVVAPDSVYREFIAAPPPDASQYTEAQMEALKDSWGYDLQVYAACPF